MRDALARDIKKPSILLDVKILPALRIRSRQISQVHLGHFFGVRRHRAPRLQGGIQLAHDGYVLTQFAADNRQDTTRRSASHPFPNRCRGGIRHLAPRLLHRPRCQVNHLTAWAKDFSALFALGIVPELRYSAAMGQAFGCRYYKSDTACYWCRGWDDRNPISGPASPHDSRRRARP